MKKYITPKFIIPALAVFLMAAGYTFLQSPRGQVILRCYAAFDIAPIADGNEITCPDGEVVTPVAQITPTPAGATVSPTPLKTSTLSVTGTQARGSATPTKTLTPAKTNTPAPTLPGVTATKPASTPTAGATVTPGGTIPPIIACLPHANKWHPPLDEPCMRHIHGIDMRSKEVVDLLAKYGFDVIAWLDKNGDLWQPAWASSPLEFVDHPAGFIWLFDNNENCDQFEGGTQDFSKQKCIVYLWERIHDDGGDVHFLNRFHSLSSIRVVCDKDENGKAIITPETCGVVATGMLGDSGEAHTPYKTAWCQILMTDAPLLSIDNPPDLLNGGLYRANQTQDGRGLLFQAWWFQQANQVDKYLYPHDPQAGYALTWISHTWQVFDPTICGSDIATMKAEAAKFPISPNGGHNLFQIFNARTFYHVPVPFNGYTDRWGHVIIDGSCTTPSLSCIPLQIVGNYPKGTDGLSAPATLQRRFEDGDCNFAPCITFATNGVTLLPPWIDAPPK